MKKFVLLGILLFASGCGKYYVTIIRQTIDGKYLASSKTNTPDPRTDHPPTGQMLIVDWHIPVEIVQQSPKGVLHVICRDYSEDVYEFPIESTNGYVSYSLLDEKFDKTGGFLTYRAEIVTPDGQVYRKWKQQLWVNVIRLDQDATIESSEDRAEWNERSSSSEEDQSTQGSVRDNPYEGLEENF